MNRAILKKKKKPSKPTVLLYSVTQIKKDVGGNQAICVQELKELKLAETHQVINSLHEKP